MELISRAETPEGSMRMGHQAQAEIGTELGSRHCGLWEALLIRIESEIEFYRAHGTVKSMG